jgi:hypothetical protein
MIDLSRIDMAGLSQVRVVSVIQALRERYPGRWRWNKARRIWEHESGWHVYVCASLAPRYDGDDDNFITEYRRSDTRELVYL